MCMCVLVCAPQPVEVGPSALGEETVALLRGVPAGCRLEGLCLVLLDEGGRPAEPGFKGGLLGHSRGAPQPACGHPFRCPQSVLTG